MSKPSKNSIGVICARFQVADLHEGHKWLIRTVAEEHEHVLILLGTSVVKGSPRNPLTFTDRAYMLQQSDLVLPSECSIHTREIKDHSSDIEWSRQVDAIIDRYVDLLILKGESVDRIAPYHEACLYGARDSALPYYHGSYMTQQLQEPEGFNHSGTAERKAILANPPHSRDYRAGKIASTADRYPINYMCVDAVIYNAKEKAILLGRKPGEDKFRFIGGFSDPTDASLEAAAEREAGEEVRVGKNKRPLKIESMWTQYIGSVRINDSRYRSEADKIMSAVIVCETNDYKDVTGADDIEEVKWISQDDLVKEDIMEAHKVIVDLLKAKWLHTVARRRTDEEVSKMFYDG